MTIKIYSDRIDIGDFTLFEGNGGVQFGGVARAERFLGGAGTFQGSVSGYVSGRQAPPASNTIDKFPFSTDTNASDVGDLTVARFGIFGCSSKTYGYAAGGTAEPPLYNTIDKFPFSADTNATDVGDLSTAASAYGSEGQSSRTHGYVAGGSLNTPATPGSTNRIEKFSFATDTNGTAIGNLVIGVHVGGGASSTTHGYLSGGREGGSPTGLTNTIQKWPFSTDTNATDVGDISSSRDAGAGQSSYTHGYASGGNDSGSINTIEKWPFSTDTNATDVGDLTQARRQSAGQSSTVSGYTSGGYQAPSSSNVIDKFPFATNTNATDVGDLTQSGRAGGGHQI
jgi:hypothetical protein